MTTGGDSGREPEALRAEEVGARRREWTLRLFPEGVRGERTEDGTSFHVVRARLKDAIQILDGGLARRTLVVRKPRRHTLQLEPSGFRRLTAWIGRPLLLRLALRQRLSWTIPIGILFVVTSLPLPGDPAAGLEPIPFNPVSATLGTVLIVQGMVSRLWPHPVFFLLDATWFLALAADTLRGVVEGRSPLWLLLVALQILLAVSGLRLWRRFAGTEPGP